MTEEIPVLDITAEDREAEALRYADAVARWQAAKREKNPVLRAAIERGELSGSGVKDDPFVVHDTPKPALPAPVPTASKPGAGRVFEWPCDRRDAHHPHDDSYWEDDEHYIELEPCPGVGAHPLTQIGGNYSEEEI